MVSYGKAACLAVFFLMLIAGFSLLSCENPAIQHVAHNISVQQIQKNATVSVGAGSSHYKIPNIVHYIWFKDRTTNIKFHHMLGILSAYKVLKPEVIYFHTNNRPDGTYWDEINRLVPTLKVLHRDPPTALFGENIKKASFDVGFADVDRTVILMEYGGIYLDMDVFIIKSFDDLRKHSCVVGLEEKSVVCGGIILAEKSSCFLKMWTNSYIDNYRTSVWAYNTNQVPTILAKRYPDLVHIEPKSLHFPSYSEVNKIWQEKYEWRNNYAMHLWYRMKRTRTEPDHSNIKTMNTTFGELARNIYYGSPDLITGSQ